MDNQPSFDRGILIPIGVGVFALIGICVILVVGRITALRGTVEEVPTATSFKYALIGTEPAITTVTFEATEFAPPAATEAPIILFTPTRSSLSTPILLSPNGTNALTNTVLRTNTPTRTPIIVGSPLTSTNTPTRTPTSASTAPFGAGTYDDVDSRLVYSGIWESISGSGYQNTLHVSGTLGNSVTFRFIGQEIRIFFQAGPSLGNISLNLDGIAYNMDQSNASTQNYEWVLPSVTNSTHTVTITHQSGGSVNLNYIIIPEGPTTPTSTATSTQ